MKKQLIDKIMLCDTAYQIREVWEEVTSSLKSDEINFNDFVTLQGIKYERLNFIEASDLHKARSEQLERNKMHVLQ